MQKYELLVLLPLTDTEAGLKERIVKIEEHLRSLGATVVGNAVLSKGRLAYQIDDVRQGHFSVIQFEAETSVIEGLRRALTLAGDALRFDILRVDGEFAPFAPVQIRDLKNIAKASTGSRPGSSHAGIEGAPRAAEQVLPDGGVSQKAQVAAPVLYQDKKGTDKKEVSMEEIDKQLEKILGE